MTKHLENFETLARSVLPALRAGRKVEIQGGEETADAFEAAARAAAVERVRRTRSGKKRLPDQLLKTPKATIAMRKYRERKRKGLVKPRRTPE